MLGSPLTGLCGRHKATDKPSPAACGATGFGARRKGVCSLQDCAARCLACGADKCRYAVFSKLVKGGDCSLFASCETSELFVHRDYQTQMVMTTVASSHPQHRRSLPSPVCPKPAPPPPPATSTLQPKVRHSSPPRCASLPPTQPDPPDSVEPFAFFDFRTPSCASLPRTRRPTEAEPHLAFFHSRKAGGSELREVLSAAGESLNLSHFIPCFESYPHSFLANAPERHTAAAHLRSCQTYHLDALLARQTAKAPALYVGHFPFHMSEWFGALGWRQSGVRQRAQARSYSCIMFVRSPISRFESCYAERLARGGRPLANLSREELSRALVETEGVHSCTNEIARWVAPTNSWGEERLRASGLVLTEDELREAKRRMDQCVVANIIESCEPTVELLATKFPWLSPFLSARRLCTSRKHSHASGAVRQTELAAWQRQKIAKHNLQDLELYEHGMRRFAAAQECAMGKPAGDQSTTKVQRRPPALPEDCRVAPETSGPRVAVLFYGVARNASATLGSLHDHLLLPLKQVASVDVFIHLMQPHSMNQKWSGETWANIHVGATNELLAALRPCRFSVTDQDAADLDLEVMVRRASEVLGHGDPKMRANVRSRYDRQVIFNLFRSRLSMQLAAKLVMAHTKIHGLAYTHLVLARPDVLYVTPLLWRPEVDSGASILVPDSAHFFCPLAHLRELQCSTPGVNDRFAIGDYPTLLTLVLGRLEWLQRFSVVRNSEHVWCTQLAAANVSVGLLQGLKLVRVRSNGERLERDEKIAKSAPLRCALVEGLRLVRDWSAARQSQYIHQERECKVCPLPKASLHY